MNILNYLERRWPVVKFLRNYGSAKEYDRNEFLRKVMNYVSASELEGDYLEFGVFRGGTFISAINTAKRKKLKKMKFYAFDSFQGFPKISGVDLEFEQFKKGGCNFSEENFRNNLQKGKVDLNNVVITSGFFEKTLNTDTKNSLNLKSVAVIWVDCDLYESTVPVLKFITNYITDGTIIVFDDWYHFRGRPDRGEQKAFREWLKDHPELTAVEFHKYSWHGNSFIINKNG